MKGSQIKNKGRTENHKCKFVKFCDLEVVIQT